jgi:hypothetical protein
MKYKGVPFREMEKATDVMDVIPIVRQAATKDRELMEKVRQRRALPNAHLVGASCLPFRATPHHTP